MPNVSCDKTKREKVADTKPGGVASAQKTATLMPVGRRVFSIRVTCAGAQNDGASHAVFEFGRACEVPDRSAVLTTKI